MKAEFGRTAETSQAENLKAYFENLLQKNRGVILSAGEKTEELIRKETIDLNDFADVVSPDVIRKESERVNEIRASIRAEATERKGGQEPLLEKLAFATEALIYRQIGISGWLSSKDVKVYVEKASDPDDLLRGSDIILEFEMGEDREPLVVSVDLTISPSGVGDKIHGVKQAIDNDKLTKVMFHTQPDGTHKVLENIPKVAVFVSPEPAVDLMKLWVEREEQQLREHPIQLAIARQVDLQLGAYEDYARRNKHPELADKYLRARAMFAMVLTEKEAKFKDAPSDIIDNSLNEIRTALNSRLRNPSSRELTPTEEANYRRTAKMLNKFR